MGIKGEASVIEDDGLAPLNPVYQQTKAKEYRRPGGPWDVPPLGVFLNRSDAEAWSLLDGSARIDGAAVSAMSGALAASLLSLGVKKGDVVAWQLPNWYEAVLLVRACWDIGAIALPIHHRLRETDLTPVLKALSPKLCFSASGFPLSDLRPCIPVRPDAHVAGLADMVQGVAPVRQAVEPGDLALALLTSGSTSTPKIVLHTHRALAYKASTKPRTLGLGHEETVLVAGPMAHINGLVNAVLLPPSASMNVVLMEAWDPGRAIGVIESEHVTYLGGPSAFLTGIVDSDEFDRMRVRSLRIAGMGGSSMTSQLIAALAETLDCSIRRTYGSTEAPSVTTTHVGDPPTKGWVTDGRPVGEAEIQISDPITGTELPQGGVGEIWARGPELFAGYVYKEQTEAAVRDGWFCTGDLGSVDEDGWLTVRGRIKELIIRGGENISPSEVEEVVVAHPMVHAAVAIAYPDRILGERVAVVVVGDERFDLDVCREWFANRRVALFKTPELVVHVTSIPLSATGKPNRAELLQTVERAASASGTGSN
jgi:cyclohexanecarboxylate-CoA ligase